MGAEGFTAAGGVWGDEPAGTLGAGTVGGFGGTAAWEGSGEGTVGDPAVTGKGVTTALGADKGTAGAAVAIGTGGFGGKAGVATAGAEACGLNGRIGAASGAATFGVIDGMETRVEAFLACLMISDFERG